MVAAAVVGSAVVGAGSSIAAGNKAAKAAKYGADKSAEVEKYMYDTTREDFASYRQVGRGALYKLADMYGVSRPIDEPMPSGGASTGSQTINMGGMFGSATIPGQAGGNKPKQQRMTAGYDGFRASPGYEFRQSEAMKAIERSAAARGALRSGGTMKAMARYADNLASSEYENYANRLAALAGVGQAATGSTAAAGAQAASGMSQAYTNAGNARASAYQNTGNAINEGVGNIAGWYLYNQGYKGR